jgi:pimeloyl-ACP methyl ester carboxylesterase
VSEYKDPCVSSDTGYDRVVIVGHSLGALISADLLRFLKSQRDSQTGRFYFSGAQPDLNRPKIQLRLFTMGNPLRQLLNRFFPYLYEWVRLAPDNSLKGNDLKSQHAPHGAPPPGIDPAAMPDPSLLNVELWLNAYRSGDYVGRSLWLNEWYDREVPVRKVPTIPGPVYVAEQTPPGACKEMCIGAGAHQHYWDPSAPDIAKKLDELISE